MAFTQVEEPSGEGRKRRGKLLGVLGLIMLFAPAIAISFVPPEWILYMIVLIVLAVIVLILSYLLVR